MPATEAQIGYGSSILLATPSAPTTYVELGEVTNISPPPLTRDLIDATHMKSPGGWRERIAGLKDGGELSVDLNFVPGSTTTQRLQEAQTEEDPSPLKIVFPDGTEWGFSVFCTGFTPAVPIDDKMTTTATFQVTGPPDFTDPS